MEDEKKLPVQNNLFEFHMNFWTEKIHQLIMTIKMHSAHLSKTDKYKAKNICHDS